MKKFNHFIAVVIFLMLAGSFSANAQKESKAFSAGFGLEAGLPLGSAHDAYNFTAGLTVRFAYHVGPGFVTLTTGALAWLPKPNAGADTKASIQIPVKAGYKYVIAKPFFVMGELGYSSFKIYYEDVNNKIASSTSGGFTFAPTVGVNFNAVELGLRYESTSLKGGSVSSVGLRLGFNF